MRLENYQFIQEGELVHDGVRYEDLAQEFGTPLYIFDEDSFRQRLRAYKEALRSDYFDTELLYASKALLTLAVARIVAQEGVGQDIVSGGELYTSRAGGVDPAKVYFHGNNKLDQELVFALEEGVGTFVVDNRQEVQRLNRLAQGQGVVARVLLRLNPGIEASTHEFIQTAHVDSKFGENIHDPEIYAVIQSMEEASHLHFAGLHSHIGSQIFEETSFFQAATEMMEFATKVQERLSLTVEEINFGGGFGVYYTEGDTPFDVVEFIPRFLEHIHQEGERLGVPLQKVTLEPGRSLVNASGSTLYRVGDIKTTLTDKHYLFIDGGMSDNIRPALYEAKYEALLANKADQASVKNYTVAGKLCESGDIIIEDLPLPEAATGDLLVVNGTGAYNYSMASNYNRLPRPAMIHIMEGKPRLTVKRETYEDLLHLEL